MDPNPPADLHYRAAVRAQALRPGAHAGRVQGPGLEPTASVPLARARDLRRLDLHTSLRDPFGQLWVRQFRQRSALRVWLLLDASASMQRWRQPVQVLALALAHSALRQGDAFGLWPFAQSADPADALTPTRSRHAVAAAIERVWSSPWQGQGVQGLADLAALLPGEPALVVLASDFLAPVDQWQDGVARLARHDVLPLWLDEPEEQATLPRWGLAPLRDAETGRQRLMWMRPALVQRWRAQADAHRQAVRQALSRQQREPLLMGSRFDADALNRQLAARGA
ncbi:hypothetical protein BurJ1DRAFT_2284 [Burkholderiales bacterium JOSHI_001]|nr:hypothetical protein BurJ1DRAFT_2284 [Burkholderiales bacterium JOSHI_001]